MVLVLAGIPGRYVDTVEYQSTHFIPVAYSRPTSNLPERQNSHEVMLLIQETNTNSILHTEKMVLLRQQN